MLYPSIKIPNWFGKAFTTFFFTSAVISFKYFIKVSFLIEFNFVFFLVNSLSTNVNDRFSIIIHSNQAKILFAFLFTNWNNVMELFFSRCFNFIIDSPIFTMTFDIGNQVHVTFFQVLNTNLPILTFEFGKSSIFLLFEGNFLKECTSNNFGIEFYHKEQYKDCKVNAVTQTFYTFLYIVKAFIY